MKGFYFHNTDIRNARAHMSQILNTVAHMQNDMHVELVLPRYAGEINLDEVKDNSNVDTMPPVVFLNNFGVKKPGAVAFVLFNIPAAWFLILKRIKGEVDFIYVRANLFLPLVLVSFLLRVPVIYESHRKPMTSSEMTRDKILCRLVTGIVVISEYLKLHYSQYGKEILVSHDAVSLKSFGDSLGKEKARNLLGLPQEKRIVMYSGTVSNLKGIPYVVSAAKALPDIDFLLVGIIAPEFKNADLPANMKLLGRKDQKEIPTLLQAADVLLLPHPKGEYSQSPMKLFEYMASGVPIVASKLPSLCEVLNDSNAILVEPENSDSLVVGIEKIFADKSLRQTLATQARVDVNGYTWEKRGEAIVGFVQELIKITNLWCRSC